LREPPKEFSQESVTWEDIGDEILQACAWGNTKGEESRFLHATSSLACACRIYSERGHLYQNLMVRWKRSDIAPGWQLDLAAPSHVRNMLFDDNRQNASTSRSVQEALHRLRIFAAKDKEIIFLVRPNVFATDFWDNKQRRWRPATEWQA